MINFQNELGRRFALLFGAVFLVVATPGLADDHRSADSSLSIVEHLFGPSSGLPAVDGINSKMAFVTSVDASEAHAVTGTVTIPIGHAFGIQIDGALADLDWSFADDTTVYGIGVHAFWRDPSRALLGFYGHAVELDIAGGISAYAAGIENEVYWDRISVENIIGFTEADYIGLSFHSRSQLAYYPTDNLRLNIGHTYTHGSHALQLGGEWALSGRAGTTASVFADTTLIEGGDTSASAGMRFYFGQSDKPLIRRHREDDPSSDGRYLLGSTILHAQGFGVLLAGYLKIEAEIYADDCGRLCRAYLLNQIGK